MWAFCDDSGSIVVHRCRGRRGGLFVFEGDATGRADRPVDRSRLIGRVRAIRTEGGIRRLGPVDAGIGTIGTLVRRALRLTRRMMGH